MPKKKKSPPPPSGWELTLAIREALRQQLPLLSSAQLNVVTHHVHAAVLSLCADPIPVGRPGQYPREEVRIRMRGLRQELSKHYRTHKTWPDTKSKWDASAEPWIKGWWRRRMQDELLLRYSDPSGEPSGPFSRFVPYPAEELAARLGPHAPKGTSSLAEVALFLGATCWGLTPEGLRGYLKPKRKSRKKK